MLQMALRFGKHDHQQYCTSTIASNFARTSTETLQNLHYCLVNLVIGSRPSGMPEEVAVVSAKLQDTPLLMPESAFAGVGSGINGSSRGTFTPIVRSNESPGSNDPESRM